MQVPFLDLRLQYASIREDILSAVTRVCDSQQFILGSEVEQLESEIAAAITIPHAIAVSSGTDALLVALMALGIGQGDEVIVPTFSFFATAGSVSRVGATPVFVDIDPETLMIDVERMRAAMTSKTKAIIPVHLYGLCADMRPLAAAADGVHIIEDAAQAIGATYHGQPAGALGTIGCFSFFPTKNLGGFGDGGLVTTTDERLAARVRLLRNHGAQPKYVHHAIGGNFRLDALQAAVLRVKLPHLLDWNRKRRANAETYRKLVANAGLTDRVRLPVEPKGRTHVYHQFVIRVPERDVVRAHLASRGIGTEVYYPMPFHRQPCFTHLGYSSEAFPNAEAASGDVLALPVYPELTSDQQQHVIDSLTECVA
jgi:dTDP-4-amino-4,6-dideoxygalactose transaminase